MQSRSSQRAAGYIWLGSALALTLLQGQAFAQADKAPAPPTGASGDKVTFKHVYKAGDVERYQVNMRLMIDQGGDKHAISISARYKETTKSASNDGARTFVQEYEESSVTTDGTQVDTLSTYPKITITVDAKGAVDAKTEGGDPMAAEQAIVTAKSVVATRSASIPPLPVAIGDTWDVELPTAFGPGPPINIKTHVKLVAVDKVSNTTEAHEILTGDGKLDMMGVDGTVHSESDVYIDSATGKLIRSSSDIKVDANAAGMVISVSVHATTKRLGPDEKPAAAAK